LGLLTCKNRLPYSLYCVGGDIKHCTIQSKQMPSRPQQLPAGELEETTRMPSYDMDRLSSRTWNPITSRWMKQLTWLRIVLSGDWCLRLALRSLVVHAGNERMTFLFGDFKVLGVKNQKSKSVGLLRFNTWHIICHSGDHVL